jgi:hypothetical protein
MNDMTLVFGIDAKTIEQLKVSWPTWHRNRRSMWDWPWIVFYDNDQLTQDTVVELVDGTMAKTGEVTVVPWPFPSCPAYDSQREKMLSGHVFVPADWCRTKWHMKLDTDALAKPHAKWLDPEWFAGDPAYVAPRWHYTKGVGFLDKLDQWGDDLDKFSVEPLRPRLDIPHEANALRVGHQRMCSWCSYYRTEFTELVAEACSGYVAGNEKLPVPSQDTTAWYVAARLGLPHRIENMKRLGWSNHARLDELRRVAAEILGGAHEVA